MARLTAEERQKMGEAFVAEMAHEVEKRHAWLTQKCKAMCGLPAHISTLDPRISKLSEFFLQELATQNVLMGRLFARMLDMMYAQKEEVAADASEGREEASRETAEDHGRADRSDREPDPGRQLYRDGGEGMRPSEADPLSMAEEGTNA